MILEKLIDLGITLERLMLASPGVEITFGDGFVQIIRPGCSIQKIEAGTNGITINSIECAIEAALSGR